MNVELLHLFADEAADRRDQQRLNRRLRAQFARRCPCCGRFAKTFHYNGAVCEDCLGDLRPAIVFKVEQVKRWWALAAAG